jgi:hypothetical protein
MDAGVVIAILLVILCAIAALDLWRQYLFQSQQYWTDMYFSAIKSNNDLWSIGFKLEGLEHKLKNEYIRWNGALQSSDFLLNQLRQSKQESTSMKEITIQDSRIYRSKISNIEMNQLTLHSM